MKDILYELYSNLLGTIAPPKQLLCGQKYLAVINELGNLGVCANLENSASLKTEILSHPDFSNYYHRVAINAWINSYVNYQNQYQEEIDIFDKIPFKSYKSVVMVGFFESLAYKFHATGIPVTIFDLKSNSDLVKPMKEQEAAVRSAEAIIITSTTLANNSLAQIISWKNKDCKLLMLGPSTPLSLSFASAINADYLFGAVFDPNPTKVMELINDGAGTKSFLPFMKKVYLAPVM